MSLRVISFTQSQAKEFGQASRHTAKHRGGSGTTGVADARARQVGVSCAEMAKTHLGRVSLRRMVKVDDVAGAVALPVSAAGRKRRGALSARPDRSFGDLS